MRRNLNCKSICSAVIDIHIVEVPLLVKENIYDVVYGLLMKTKSLVLRSHCYQEVLEVICLFYVSLVQEREKRRNITLKRIHEVGMFENFRC